MSTGDEYYVRCKKCKTVIYLLRDRPIYESCACTNREDMINIDPSELGYYRAWGNVDNMEWLDKNKKSIKNVVLYVKPWHLL